MNYDSTPKTERSSMLSLRNVLAAGGVAIALAVGTHFEQQDKDHEHATEACVGALVGHKVNLVPSADGTLQRPASVFEEQLACEQNGDNIQAAAEALNIDLPVLATVQN